MKAVLEGKIEADDGLEELDEDDEEDEDEEEDEDDEGTPANTEADRDTKTAIHRNLKDRDAEISNRYRHWQHLFLHSVICKSTVIGFKRHRYRFCFPQSACT